MFCDLLETPIYFTIPSRRTNCLLVMEWSSIRSWEQMKVWLHWDQIGIPLTIACYTKKQKYWSWRGDEVWAFTMSICETLWKSCLSYRENTSDVNGTAKHSKYLRHGAISQAVKNNWEYLWNFHICNLKGAKWKLQDCLYSNRSLSPWFHQIPRQRSGCQL